MKKEKFDLQKALAGHKLITRNGLLVKNFRNSGEFVFPYMADIENKQQLFTEKGKYTCSENPNRFDLFLLEEDFTPKEGDRVEVGVGKNPKAWATRMFLHKDKSGKILCVEEGYEKSYIHGGSYNVTVWNEMRPIKKPEIQITVDITLEDNKPFNITEEMRKEVTLLIKQIRTTLLKEKL